MTLFCKKLIPTLLLIAALAALFGLGALAAETDPLSVPTDAAEAEQIGETAEPEQAEEVAEPEQVEETAAPEQDEKAVEAEQTVETAESVEADAASEETASEETVDITVTFLDEDGKELTKTTLKAGQALTEVPLRGDKPVLRWYCVEKDIYYTGEELLKLSLSSSVTLRDAGQKITYLDKDKKTVLGTEYVKTGGSPKGLKDSKVTNWLDKDGKFVILSKQSISADTSFTAWYSPGLNTAHTAYINGVTDTKFYPGNRLNRAQAATILYNLLLDKSKGPFEVKFSDVKSSDWYAEAVNTLASWGIITGQTATTFGPKADITRGDFVLMISRLFTLESGTWSYADGKETDYFRDAVAVASAKGWITGYADGTFKGRAYITRAEAVTVINRVLNRTPDKKAIDKLGHIIFLDVNSNSYWAYYQIMEAATNDGYALRPIKSLKKGIQQIGDKLYYVDDTKTFVTFSKGVQKIDGKSYYLPSAGAAIPIYSTGIHDFSAKSDGSKLYFIQKDHSIRTEPDKGNVYPVFEYNKHMYCLHTDGRLLSNENYGHGLYFGKNGAYTSGDTNLDNMTYKFLTQTYSILNSSKTQERKLYAAYTSLIDYADAYKKYANYSKWTGQYCAQIFLQNARGSCAEFAWAMVYLAQRLGVDCQIEWGTVRSGASHVWELVYWPDGKTYLLDAEQEWGYWDGAGGRYASGLRYDCYMLPWKPGEYMKYGNRFNNPITNVWSPYTVDHSK